jgi:hypothetical protein
MTAEWMGMILDSVLILVVGIGIVQATRLILQLQDLRKSRAEMERFVREFNGAIVRAEAGIKTLRGTARESGDDLEKLVEKANMVRDELTFIVESADSLADRLSIAASKVVRSGEGASAKAADKPSAPVEQREARKPTAVASVSSAKTERAPFSRAEQELAQALKKLG